VDLVGLGAVLVLIPVAVAFFALGVMYERVGARR
jgi:hypothetical protein